MPTEVLHWRYFLDHILWFRVARSVLTVGSRIAVGPILPSRCPTVSDRLDPDWVAGVAG